MSLPKSQAVKDLEDLALEDLKLKYPSNPYPPKKKYSDRTTNGLTKCIIDFLNLSGCQAERINSMGRRLDKRKTVTDCVGRSRTIGNVEWIKGNGRPGTADISATISGRSVKVEVKCKATGDHYQSQDQQSYQQEIEAAGGIYVIARSFEDFRSWYLQFINQNPS